MSNKGTALRVGSEIWVPPNATEADHEAAWAMMTPTEIERTSREMVRTLKWAAWRMKHPRWAAFLDAAYACGLAADGG